MEETDETWDGIKLLLTRFGMFAFKSRDHKQYYLIIPYNFTNRNYKYKNIDISKF